MLRKTAKTSGVPKKYLSGLSSTQKKKRASELKKGAKLYKEGKKRAAISLSKKRTQYKNVKEKRSSYSVRFEKKYGKAALGNKTKIKELTGMPIAAQNEVLRKGRGAFVSSGSRPNQSAQSWAWARLYSFILGGKARQVDKSVFEKYNFSFRKKKA